MDAQSSKAIEPQSQTNPRRFRWWLWFLPGFALVFLAAFLFAKMYLPYRDGIESATLWKYYVIGIPQFFKTQTLGPQSGLGAAPVETLFQHLLVSFIGGTITCGLAFTIRKLRFRR
jgi:hypothetical protein